MGNTIKFGVYKNPSKDVNGKESYHVRHETNATLNDKYIADHVAHYNEPEAPHIKGVVSVLKKNIVEILTDNRNVHIEGLGNFYLKLGFRTRTDENGQEVKPHFTDPAKITGNDIVVKGIGFTPDEEFLKELLKKDYHFENATGRGKVGHSAEITKEQAIQRLDTFFETRDHIVRREIEGLFGLTKYKAQQLLEDLCTMAPPYLKATKIGSTLMYTRR